jgi:hypothetical protein
MRLKPQKLMKFFGICDRNYLYPFSFYYDRFQEQAGYLVYRMGFSKPDNVVSF